MSVQPNIVERLLSENMIPVVSTIGADETGQAYNINADTRSLGHLAGALGAEKAIYLIDVPGLLTDIDDPGSIVARATVDEARVHRRRDHQRWHDPESRGMHPCRRVRRTLAHMLDGRIPHALVAQPVHRCRYRHRDHRNRATR